MFFVRISRQLRSPKGLKGEKGGGAAIKVNVDKNERQRHYFN